MQAEMKVSSDGTLRERSAKDMTAAAKYPLAGALDLVPRYLGDMCIYMRVYVCVCVEYADMQMMSCAAQCCWQFYDYKKNLFSGCIKNASTRQTNRQGKGECGREREGASEHQTGTRPSPWPPKRLSASY